MLDMAGERSTAAIGRKLRRSPGAVRDRITRIHGLDNRLASGHMTLAECAREYKCPEVRVRNLIRRGLLKAHLMPGAHFWRIAPEDAEEASAYLTAPRVTWKAG